MREATSSGTAAPSAGRSRMRREIWLPATPASARTARHLVRDAAAEVDLEAEHVWDLMLATTEAVANAVCHGKAWPNGCVLLVIDPCPRGLCVEVCDLGTFDSTPEPAPLGAISGRGMQLIAALVDRFEVRNGDGQTLVRLEKRAGPEAHVPGANGASPDHRGLRRGARQVRPTGDMRRSA